MPVLTSTTLYLIYPIKNSPGKHHYCNKIWWMHNNDCSRVVPSDSYYGKRRVTCFSSKKKLGLMDQILDYIEGGPKLRKWYGAPDLLPKEGSASQVDEISEEDEVRDAVLVTDGDSEIGQMVILSLIVKRIRVKALVKDKRAAVEAFGIYVESMAGDSKDRSFLKRALRGVRAVICVNEGFLSNVESWKGLEHVILLSQVLIPYPPGLNNSEEIVGSLTRLQLSVYRGNSGIRAMITSSAQKLAEQDESILMASGIPYTIIRTGLLKNAPGGQGFSFEKGSATRGSLSKEDSAFICVEALDAIPQKGLVFEVVNGGETVSDWKKFFAALMEKSEQ